MGILDMLDPLDAGHSVKFSILEGKRCIKICFQASSPRNQESVRIQIRRHHIQSPIEQHLRQGACSTRQIQDMLVAGTCDHLGDPHTRHVYGILSAMIRMDAIKFHFHAPYSLPLQFNPRRLLVL